MRSVCFVLSMAVVFGCNVDKNVSVTVDAGKKASSSSSHSVSSSGVLADGGSRIVSDMYDGGTSADAGVDAGPTKRLKVGQFTNTEGLKFTTVTLFDTKLKALCQPSADYKGVFRCFPSGSYKAPTYRGMDPKTGECVEEIIVAPDMKDASQSIAGIQRNGAPSIHKIGSKIITAPKYWIEMKPNDSKKKCIPQDTPPDFIFFSLGEDITSNLAEMKFNWVDSE